MFVVKLYFRRQVGNAFENKVRYDTRSVTPSEPHLTVERLSTKTNNKNGDFRLRD